MLPYCRRMTAPTTPHPAAPAAPAPADAFLRDLRQAVRGEVHADDLTRGIYATDASHYQVTPRCVVVPLDRNDVVAAVKVAAAHGVPVTARGGGTSLSGQTTWTGVVIDLSKHLAHVLEVDAEGRWARVEPGVVRDHLNKAVKTHGLHFAPDPATTSRATVGGMVGNNTSGTRSILYGKTSDHVLELTVVLADGAVLTFRPEPPERWRELAQRDTREGELYRGVAAIVEANRDEIERRYPKVMRRVSGYALDAFLGDGPRSLADLFVGSEGTLGVLLEAKVRLEPLPAATAMVIGHFDDVIASLAAVPRIVEHGPSAVELLDDVVCAEAVRNPATKALTGFIEADPVTGGPPKGLLICEFYADSADAAREKAAAFAAAMQGGDAPGTGHGYAWPIRLDAAKQAEVWEVRKLGLGLISNVPGPVKGQAFIEDACVPVEVLADYIRRVLDICHGEGVKVSVYAHASVGVIHCRPMLDLHRPADVATMQRIAERCFELVVGYGGSWSSEHGDGLLRGWSIERFYGPRLAAAFRDVKRLFDPARIMNPGKAVDPAPPTENLRYGGGYRLDVVPAMQFAYQEQGGFARAVEQCNGVGACRKVGSGTMCPSYMATRDEEHTTRGRANALRLAMTGQLGEDALTGERVKEALDLCLSCKACKSECPNLVDMSRLKADVAQLRHDRHGTPLSARMIANLPRSARLAAGPLAPLVNALQRSAPGKWALEKMGNIDRRRDLPAFARRRFRPRKQNGKMGLGAASNGQASGRGEVVLFADTYTQTMEPRVGEAALRLLEGLGYTVTVARPGCCQRPAMSQGMLRHARKHGRRTLQNLDQLGGDAPILVLEPSCCSALTDDLPDLMHEADRALGHRVVTRTKMLDVFLAEALDAADDPPPLSAVTDRVLLHGHCHQKALYGTAGVESLLRRAGATVDVVDAGCCGMAGAFGYEHHDLSMTIAESRLFPAVRAARAADADVAVCAPGLSCRHQLHDGLGVTAKHWVELIAPGANDEIRMKNDE